MLCIHINDDVIVHVCDVVLSSSLESSPAHRHVASISLSSVSRSILDGNGSIGNGDIDGGSDDGDEGDNDKDEGVSGGDDAPCIYDDIKSSIKQSVSNIFLFLLYISIVSFFILIVDRDDDDDVTAVLCDVDIVLSDIDDGDESSVSFDMEDNDFGLSTVISRKTSKVMMMIMRRRKREREVMVPVNKRFSKYFGGILNIFNNLENK